MLTLVIVRNNVTLARDAIRLLAKPSLRSLQVPVTAPAKATTPIYGNKKNERKNLSFFIANFRLVAFLLTLVIVRNNVTLARDAIRLLAIPSLRSLQVPVTAPAKATTPIYGNKKMRGKTSLFLLQILG